MENENENKIKRHPEQQKLIHEVLGSPDWTESEKAVVKWQFGLYGSFYSKLFIAMMSADHINLKRLELAFPDEVRGFRAFREGDELANKIDKAIGL